MDKRKHNDDGDDESADRDGKRLKNDRKQLKDEKDKLIEMLIEEIREEKEKIRTLEEEAKRKDKEIREKDEELIEEKGKGSIYTSLETLLHINEGKFEKSVDHTGNNTSHKSTRHQIATAVEMSISLAEPKMEKLAKNRPASRLLQEFVKQDNKAGDLNNIAKLVKELKFSTVPCHHEADYAALVRNAAQDAICILRINGEADGETFSTNMERSLFSVRPDILVVRNKKRLAMLAIEVKRPEEEYGKLVKESRILGHVFDQAQAMRAFGKGSSIVILTNFLESSICSVDKSVFADESSQSVNQLPQAVPSTPQVARCLLASQSSPEASLSPPNAINPPSDPPITRTVSKDSSSPSNSSNSDCSAADDLSLFKPSDGRKMWRTPPFKPHQLVRLIYTALLLGLKEQKDAVQTTYKLEQDKQYHVEKAIKVIGGGDCREIYCWGDFKFKMGKSVNEQTTHRSLVCKKKQDAFYIIGELGYGSTSNVFHAVTSCGDEVAIKLYLSNVDQNEKVLSLSDFQKQAQAATEKEAANLKKMYPFLNGKVRSVKLFGDHYAVVMPKFEPIPNGNRNISWMDTNVKPVLQTFSKKALKYKDDDVRWRHVGTYTDDNKNQYCILYDLAELEEATQDDNSFVEEHFRQLLERIPKDNKQTMEA